LSLKICYPIQGETFTVEGYNSLFRHFLARSVENQNATAKAWRCQIFCNPVNAKMEQWTTSYIKLTMPKMVLFIMVNKNIFIKIVVDNLLKTQKIKEFLLQYGI